MKKILTVILITITFLSCSSEDNSESDPINYKSVQKRLDEGLTPINLFKSGIVLDSLYAKKYQGGYIYYLDTEEGSGLIAHFQDNSSAVIWGDNGNVATANLVTIGSGNNNSSAIMSFYLNTNTAADFCNNITINNYSDWFLPSKDEMKLMIERLKDKPNMFFGAVTGYWTSSNIDFNSVWIIKSDKNPISFFKNNMIYYDVRIRATRKFNQ
jgi:hypothetical protein